MSEFKKLSPEQIAALEANLLNPISVPIMYNSRDYWDHSDWTAYIEPLLDAEYGEANLFLTLLILESELA